MLAALGVFVRDIGQLTGFVSSALMFASAVSFPPEKIPAELHFLHYNPLFQIVDLARKVVLWQQTMPFDKLAYVYASSLVVCAAGAVFFSLLRKSFAEVI